MIIEDLGMNGEGIAHENGKAVFMPFYLPGEIIENGKIIKKSEFRITPVCPYFKACGGCNLQHLKYEKTLKFKQNKIKNVLNKFKINVEVLECEPSAKIFNYRNKITLKCDGKKLGLYKLNSHEIVEIEDCKLASEEINSVIKIIKEIKINNIKEIIIQNYNKNILVTFKLINNDFNNIKLFKEKIKNYTKNYAIFAEYEDKTIFHAGEKYFIKEEFNIKYPFTNKSFYQVNDEIKNKIYSDILCNITSNDEVLDAYSGSGLLSAIIAKVAKKVVGVEIVKPATINANKLKEINKLCNLENINGDTAKLIDKIKFNVCVLDPPRAGVNIKVIQSLNMLMPEKIIYLSCNPATLARDLKLLENNYNIISLKPYDMFPNTCHVETLVIMCKKNNKF